MFLVIISSSKYYICLFNVCGDGVNTKAGVVARGQLEEVSSFHYVGLWYWTQVIKLVKAFIHWAIYFIGPISSSERQLITVNLDYNTQ